MIYFKSFEMIHTIYGYKIKQILAFFKGENFKIIIQSFIQNSKFVYQCLILLIVKMSGDVKHI